MIGALDCASGAVTMIHTDIHQDSADLDFRHAPFIDLQFSTLKGRYPLRRT